MIKVMYVERKTWLTVYAIDAKEAIEMFEAAGIDVDAVKEIGTDNWTAKTRRIL